ncbi:hypothetical protein FHG87_018091 [Trinorchestia longiramus]|nr:hypothetical protein FHG87_018091 [Trinorchestia longiramus]
MADESNSINEDLDSRSKEKKEKKHDSGAADLERVTNYAEEKEIKSDADILSVINNVKRQEYADKVKRDQELAKVAIKKQDVELLMRELEVTKQVAERSLREHKGSLSATLVMLTN